MSRLTGWMLVAVLSLACGVVMAQENGKKDAKDAPKTKPTMGKITKIEGKTLTVSVRAGKNEPAADQTIKLEDTTKILIETGEPSDVKSEKGRPVSKTKDGKLEDLKVDQNVRILTAEDGKVTQVTVVAPRAGGKGGDKGGKGGEKGGEKGAEKGEGAKG